MAVLQHDNVVGTAQRVRYGQNSAALNALAKEGYIPTIDELPVLSPYLTRQIKCFGNDVLDLAAIPAPATDDLTFEIEPPQEVGTIEADHSTLPEPNGE